MYNIASNFSHLTIIPLIFFEIATTDKSTSAQVYATVCSRQYQITGYMSYVKDDATFV